MPDDSRSLLAAIVADPSDDTVRLAYADCIEEQGNAARAAFIRLQIEAERLHPDSNARLALEQQAEALFAEHWIEWWAEVCAAVGLFVPRGRASSIAGRAARWLANLGSAGDDNPYFREAVGVRWDRQVPSYPDRFALAEFCRGFPESLSISFFWPPTVLDAWPTVSPLVSITATGSSADGWDDGSYLRGVRSIRLHNFEPKVFQVVARSANLTNLEDVDILEEIANHTIDAVRLLSGRNLKRISLQVWNDADATAVAEAPHFASLTALVVNILPDRPDDYEGTSRRIATLAQSPHLAGLQELTVYGQLNPEGCSALVHGSWRGLRKLTIDAEFFGDDPADCLAVLFQSGAFPALEELRIDSIFLRREAIDLLIRSPLMKQLRHFACSAWGVDGVSDADLRRLPELFDLDRLETFRFNPDHDMPGLDELKRQLGDRLRMP